MNVDKVIERYNEHPAALATVLSWGVHDSHRPCFVIGQQEPTGYSGEIDISLRLRVMKLPGEITYRVTSYTADGLAEAVQGFLALLGGPQ